MYIRKGGGGTRCHAGKRAGSRDTCLFYCVCKHKQKASPSPALAGLAQLTKPYSRVPGDRNQVVETRLLGWLVRNGSSKRRSQARSQT